MQLIKFFRTGLVILSALIILSAGKSFAAEDAQSSDMILESYKDYANAGYAVRWNVKNVDLLSTLSSIPRYQYFILYTSMELLKNSNSPKVQFGFFKSVADANTFVKELGSVFPGAIAVRVSEREHRQLFAEDSNLIWLGPQYQNRTVDSTQDLFQNAKEAYIAKDYKRSLALYSVLSLSADQQSRVWALELVGVSQERLGQRSEAMETYRALLAKNPEGNWVSRVQQRLRALETAADDEKDSLRTSKFQAENKDFYWRGFLGQTYNSVTQSSDLFDEDRETLEAVSTYYDFFLGTTILEGHQFEARLAGYDLMDLQEDGDHDRTRLKRFYLSYTHDATGLNVVGGRQRDKDAGVFGYFDGASLNYPLLNEKITVGVKAGVPVRFSDFYDAYEHQFFSIYSNYQVNSDWLLGVYMNNQTLYSEVDRGAFGGRVNYSGKKLFGSFYFDYDYEFSEFNVLRLSSNYVHSEKSRFVFAFGSQRNPFLSASNIQIGQPYLNLEAYLQDQFNRQFVLYNALQRTSLYEFGSLSYHRKVDEDMNLSFDLYHANSTDMPVFESSDGWITTEIAEQSEYTYSTAGIQAVIKGFFGEQDLATMSYRYGDTTYATINTLNFSDRFRLGKKVFLKPGLGLRLSKNKESESELLKGRLALRVSYKPWRSVELYLDAGNEVIEDIESKDSFSSNYLFAGYQVRF